MLSKTKQTIEALLKLASKTLGVVAVLIGIATGGWQLLHLNDKVPVNAFDVPGIFIEAATNLNTVMQGCITIRCWERL
jgi:TRAP-type C4-dicarboxylate transport system permease small subunit